MKTTRYARQYDMLASFLVGYAVGGGTVPDVSCLRGTEADAVSDAAHRDGSQIEGIVAWLASLGIEWRSGNGVKVPDAVCKRLCDLREVAEKRAALAQNDEEMRQALANDRPLDDIIERRKGLRGC